VSWKESGWVLAVLAEGKVEFWMCYGAKWDLDVTRLFGAQEREDVAKSRFRPE